MPENSLKCYGIYIDASEAAKNISTGVIGQLLEGKDLVGVYQDPAGLKKVFIFYKKEHAKAAVKKAKELGIESVELCPTMIYVPEKDVQN